MENVIAFDLGGTLMEYEGMQLSWISYYEDCFNNVNEKYSLNLCKDDIEKSIEILREYNPRYKAREIEYSSEFLFTEATKHWNVMIPINDIISAFFSGMKLKANIYKDTISVLNGLHELGYKVAILTNLPSSMPDRLFKKDIQQILNNIDLYVSSEICGYRKPNKAGLLYIAEYFDTDVKKIIFIGDEKLDIDTSKNAGCKSVLISRDNDNIDYNQDYKVKNLNEIYSIINRNLRINSINLT